MPLWLLYTVFPFWNCKFAVMAFVRYVNIRPESLATKEELLKCPFGIYTVRNHPSGVLGC